MIEFLWDLWKELWGYLTTNFDPFRDTTDILLVALGVYWIAKAPLREVVPAAS